MRNNRIATLNLDKIKIMCGKLFLLCCLVVALSCSEKQQPVHTVTTVPIEPDTLLTVKDFNLDGVPDTIRQYQLTPDSKFRQKAELIDGATRRRGMVEIAPGHGVIDAKHKSGFSISAYGPYAGIKNIVPIKKFFDSSLSNAFYKQILPPERQGPDPSLEWLMNAAMSPKTNLRQFYKLFSVTPKWYDGKPELPAPYSLPISRSTVQKLTKDNFNKYVMPNAGDFRLVYNPGYHLRFDTLAVTDQGIVLNTKFGFVLVKDNKYRWLFIADSDFMCPFDPTHFMRDDIGSEFRKKPLPNDNILICEGCMVVELRGWSMYLYAIDIETGICARIGTSFFGDVPNSLIAHAFKRVIRKMKQIN